MLEVGADGGLAADLGPARDAIFQPEPLPALERRDCVSSHIVAEGALEQRHGDTVGTRDPPAERNARTDIQIG